MTDISEKGIVRAFFTKKYEKIVDSLLVTEIEENPSNSNRELIHNITTSLINASIEKYKRDKKFPADMTSDQVSDSLDSFWKDENFKQENDLDTPPLPVETYTNSSFKTDFLPKEHFLDIFVDKLISRIVHEKLPEREQFAERTYIPDERKQQPISATTLGRNLGKLGGKMCGLFDLQESIIRLLTWRNPSGTVTLLIVFTIICYNPISLIIFPLLNLMYGVMIPGYTHRHPLHHTIYPRKKVYGRSLLEDVTTGGQSNAWYPSNVLSENLSKDKYDNQNSGSSEGSQSQNNISHGMEVVINIRDFQNITSSLVELNESLDKFVYGTAGFKDERESSLLFFSCFIATLILWLASSYIQWSLFLSSSGWIIMISAHPKICPHLFNIIESERIKRGKKVLEKKQKFDVILDEPPEMKYVEIFEIYEQGITPRHWKFYKYSNHVFDLLDHYRKLQQPPPGVDKLDDIVPPKTWSFDENFPWEIDQDVTKWSSERGIQLESDGEYLLDSNFKRRRLIRKVLRYAKPANKPPTH